MTKSRSLVAGAFLLALAVAPLAEASFINYSSKEIHLKIVYFGPSGEALRKNVQHIYERTAPDAKGKLITLKSGTGETHFFDFAPKEMEIRGFKVRFHLYSGGGDEANLAARKLSLKGVDGVIFVAEGDPAKSKATLASWKQLHSHLREQGDVGRSVQVTVQIDQSSGENAIKAAAVTKLLGLEKQPVIEADPSTGRGVFDALKAVAKQTLMQLKSQSGTNSAAGESSRATTGELERQPAAGK